MNKGIMTRLGARSQRGVGLVELMVTMLLSALVVIGVIQVFNANRQTFRMQDSMSIAQETGTFAVDFIGHDLLRAGIPATAVNDLKAYNVAIDLDHATDGGTGANDKLAIAYDPSLTSYTYCNGDTVPATVKRIASLYAVNASNQLTCQGESGAVSGNDYAFTPVGTAQVLADNVESFQVLYGVTTDHTGCPSGAIAPTMYVKASLVKTAIDDARTACPTTGSNDPSLASSVVRSVRIGLLLRTEKPSGSIVANTKTYAVLDQTIGSPAIDPSDGRLRRLFTKTVLLRAAQATLY